tara:strand:+ start:184 stop:615 length:432 start_codon:yes stop_codon:yes gene_type:complete
MEKSERRKASEDAVNRRLQKSKKEKLAKAKRSTQLAKAADIGPKDFNVKKDSARTGIKKEIKYAVSGPQTQRQRLRKKASDLKKRVKNISKFQDKISDPKSKLVESTKEYKEVIPKAMGGYKSGGRVCKLATKGKGRAYGKNS